MGNKITFLQHACLALLGTCAKGVQFYCPSLTYAAIPYLGIPIFLYWYIMRKKILFFSRGRSEKIRKSTFQVEHVFVKRGNQRVFPHRVEKTTVYNLLS